jgi:hypothetical protein
MDNGIGAGLGALAGVFVIISIVLAVWLFVAPLIMTIQLAGINRKLKDMLARGQVMPPRI